MGLIFRKTRFLWLGRCKAKMPILWGLPECGVWGHFIQAPWRAELKCCWGRVRKSTLMRFNGIESHWWTELTLSEVNWRTWALDKDSPGGSNKGLGWNSESALCKTSRSGHPVPKSPTASFQRWLWLCGKTTEQLWKDWPLETEHFYFWKSLLG